VELVRPTDNDGLSEPGSCLLCVVWPSRRHVSLTRFKRSHFSSVVLAGKDFFAPPPLRQLWPAHRVAWSLNSKMVLRAGYGSTGIRFQLEASTRRMISKPRYGPTRPHSQAMPTRMLILPRVVSQHHSTTIQGLATPLPTAAPGQWWLNDDPTYKDPYSHQWHIELQRQLTRPQCFRSLMWAAKMDGCLIPV